MENPTKIEIEGLKTIHKLCKFGADHNMEGCSFAEIVERMFDELQQAQKVAVPEGFVLVPKLSANYLFNIVPELGFKHQDQKDTVLYHLNYMASEFKDSAKKFIEADHAKQKEMIKAQEPAND